MGYVGFRLSDAQEAKIRAQAKKERITLSELCRKRILTANTNTDGLKDDLAELRQQMQSSSLTLSQNIKTLADNLERFDADRAQDIQLLTNALAYLVDNSSYQIAVILEILQRDILHRYTNKNTANRLITEAYNAAKPQGS